MLGCVGLGTGGNGRSSVRRKRKRLLDHNLSAHLPKIKGPNDHVGVICIHNLKT